MDTKTYFKDFEDNIRLAYAVAGEARKKGLDPSDKVEIPLVSC